MLASDLMGRRSVHQPGVDGMCLRPCLCLAKRPALARCALAELSEKRQLRLIDRSRWRKTAGRQRWAAAVALSLALMVLQGLIVRPDSYEGRFVPLFAAQQWLYQRWYKSHDYYLGALATAHCATMRPW